MAGLHRGLQNIWDNMQTAKPTIADTSAHAEFIDQIVDAGLDPEDPWVGGYVSVVWERARPFFLSRGLPAHGSKVLEFGCNFGATSVMLASMGANVTAIDINPSYVNIARTNARAYGVSMHTEFLHVGDTRRLPFGDQSFDLVVCNSVLEYVDDEHLDTVLREIDRVLKTGGILFVLGTSNKLWPREVHSGVWLVNYIPSVLDPLLRRIVPKFERGLNPWRLVRSLDGYENLDASDQGKSLMEGKRKTSSPLKCALLQLFGLASTAFGTSLGLLLPSIMVALKKNASSAQTS